ncbi:hypothetical protein KM043_017561 [Ampulex compressa]|nr:hypothetical protein KM043_017561 [Ampulex compressa]
MENLEEVLQALDEFQKMRPTEIPRELEDYLCWVAKTGDPVYQWSLIKTLFREKLTRVMTDFYESCPSLELAPCPNVEHFNYDTMKSNLLERLESFANAPFTVQRICELLTAPRKEYNRIDKFMRAIEKNILVVSTREPGPIARRSDNGDGMVNGSAEEDATSTQPPQDVEMEYWEKDCSSTVTISVHTVENDAPLLHAVLPSTTVGKNTFGTDNGLQDKADRTSPRSEAQPQEAVAISTTQNLSTIVSETSGIASDVPEAIMNEDTSSQPSLDLENEETDIAETVDASRKLQTTFQAKDFAVSESKSPKFYADNKVHEKAESSLISDEQDEQEENTIAKKGTEIPVKLTSEHQTVLDNRELVNVNAETLLKPLSIKIEEKPKSNILGGSIQTDQTIERHEINVEDKRSLAVNSADVEDSVSTSNTIDEKTDSIKSSSLAKSTFSGDVETIMLSTNEELDRISLLEKDSKENTSSVVEDISLNIEVSKERNMEAEVTNELKPIVEEPPNNETTKEIFMKHSYDRNRLTITEAIEDDTRIVKSIVPDPIPIIEEPKDMEPNTEISKKSEYPSLDIECDLESQEKLMPVENHNEDSSPSTPTVSHRKDNQSISDGMLCKKVRESVELMDVDEEEALSIFHQDEPMEQDVAEASKS